MTATLMRTVVQHLRKAVLVREMAGLTAGQLLERFIAQKDEAAFAALVRLHGPMVMGVCRRMLRCHHDAEDAFQATFLVLARKADSVVPREMVANWLYGVAYQTALKAKAMAARRRGRERQVMQMPEPEAQQDQDSSLDLRSMIDEELSQMPDKYRVPIVLCDLEEKSRKEAARQVGWPEGTLSGRLSRARQMLATRLARRGLTISGGLVALSPGAALACVPAPLVVSTVKAASLFAAGHAAAGVTSAEVAALTEGVLKAMMLTKLKISTIVLLAVGLLVSGVGLTRSPSEAAVPGVQQAARFQGQKDKDKNKDDGQQNQKDDGQKNQNDDGQKNQKDDGQKNQVDDAQKGQKEDGQKNEAVVKTVDREKGQLTVSLTRQGKRLDRTFVVANHTPVSLNGKPCALKDLKPGMSIGLHLGKQDKVVAIKIARLVQDKKDGQDNNKDDGQKGQNDDGQKNQKEDGQQNNKDDGQKGQKEEQKE